MIVGEGDEFEEIIAFTERMSKEWKVPLEVRRNENVLKAANHTLGTMIKVDSLSERNQAELGRIGFDEEESLGTGETGSRAASPIWLAFMQAVLEDKPVRVFQVPEGVVFAKIDAETGLLAVPESEQTIFECFKEGTVPTEYTKKVDAITDQGQFFKSDM